MEEERRAVCIATAATHAEAKAFLTPYDDSGSTKDAASPTSSIGPDANVCALYTEASNPHGPPSMTPVRTNSARRLVLCNSAAYTSAAGRPRARFVRCGSTIAVTWRSTADSGTDQAHPSA